MAREYQPVIAATPAFRADGTLYSEQFDDVYSSAHGSLEQAQHVFLAGNRLPDRWQARRKFVIVETGFGAGINFLATWQQWKSTAPADAWLHFVSVEKHPFRRDDLAKIHARHPGVEFFARQLHAKWPVLLPGFHRLHFEGGRLTLTLLFGDAAEMLGQLEATADAFMLDGFAPARNEAMWSNEVFAELARLAASGATCATYTVAASVRRGLSAAGFAVEKRPGFASKNEMLFGSFEGTALESAAPSGRHAIVVGAGLAGASCADRLAGRGWTVELYERHEAPAKEASGNPAGLIRPVVSADWNTHSRFTTASFLYGTNHYRQLEAEEHRIVRGEGGVLQLARNLQRFDKQQAMVDAFGLPADFVRTFNRAEASDLAGVPVVGAGWWFPDAMWASPASMCEANLARAGSSLTAHFDSAISSIEWSDGAWQVRNLRNDVFASAPILILANALDASLLKAAQWLPMRPVRGQVSFVPVNKARPLKIAVSGDGYASPAVDGWHCVGASFNEGMVELEERIEDHAGNLARLQRMVPGYAEGAHAGDLKGRVALRTMARDRLPIVGALGPPGLYGCLALGSRGMTWSALAAELLASQISGEPLPMERDLTAALAPTRFRSPYA